MRVAGALVALIALVLLAAGRVAPAEADPPVAGYPDSMAATGDSITQAMDTTSFGDHPEDSWATGTNPSVNSVYSRLLAVHPPIAGQRFNDSVSGARMTHLNGQAASAVSQGADLVTILMGANDVCTTSEASMTSVATYQAQFTAGMQTLASGLPDARIAVVSIPDIYNLWSILHNNGSAQFIWNVFDICQSLLLNPASTAPADVTRRANVRQRNIDFDIVLHDVCAQYIHCKFDGYAGFSMVFTPAHVSTLDYFHPSILGQALAAQAAWDNGYDFTDATPPVSDSAGAGVFNGATVTLTAADVAGVSGIEYRVNGGAYQKYSAPLSLTKGQLLTWRAVDVNGNSEATHACRIGDWTWVNGDSDCDSYPDSTTFGAHAPESTIGTLSNQQCAATPAINDEPLPDAWPLDFNDNRLVNGADILSFNTRFGSSAAGGPPYDPRWDLNASGLINGADILQFNTFFGKFCT
jgi:lysophospholipase L1-like esterase